MTHPFTWQIELEQHTPLIHFQYGSDRATLRATEMKPKLDRYILYQYGKECFDTFNKEEYEVLKNKYREKHNQSFDNLSEEGKDFEVGKYMATKKGWIVGDGSFPSLDYKIRCTSPQQEVWDFTILSGINHRTGKPNKENIPMFFGNMEKKGDGGSNQTYKKLVMCPENNYITLTFFSLHTELISVIKEQCIKHFFLTTNFGTRQSKGFGSFCPKENNLSKENFSNYYYFVIKPEGEDRWHLYSSLFSQIDLLYKTLRSGINQGNCYFKSLMFHYAIHSKSYYDKRCIRQYYKHFKPDMSNDKGEKEEVIQRPWNDELKTKSRLYRDMLGLSSLQEWKDYHAIITKENDSIARFKSPITFKPIMLPDKSFIVLILPTEIPNGILNQKFTICSKSNNRGPYIGDNEEKTFSMNTPEKFNIHDFLHYAFAGDGKKIALKQLHNAKNANTSIAKTLIPIFESIHCPTQQQYNP